MAEDGYFGFAFKSTEKDGRTKLADPYDTIKTTVYDTSFDPWSETYPDDGEAGLPDAEIGGADAFEFLL